MMRYTFGICTVFLLVFFSVAQAQTSDEFNVNLSVNTADTTPPTTPASLTATPIASSQIDLSWIASTDDVALGGYQVFRDTIQIATTTLTTYSDTGLTASTTYSYYVTAFDTSFNYSSTSNVAATTTLPLTPTTTPSTGDDHDAKGVVSLLSFEIIPDIYTATLNWRTSRFAQFQLRWGRTTAYELGFVSNEVFKREHSTVITELQGGTTYEYELIAYNKDGNRFVLSRGQFTTLAIPDANAPSNVRNLTASVQGDDVVLSWENPPDADFSHVRMVRSHLFYPTDPYDGFIAYQGKGQEFFDADAVASRKIQYYTVFSYDYRGNVSSGATVAVFIGDAPSYETATSSEDLSLTFLDVEVLQNNTRIDDGVLNNALPVTLRIAYEKLPEHLKTIIVSMTHPHDASRSFSFLLRINKDKTYYEATLAPLRDTGEYPVAVTIFDYQTRLLKQVHGSYTVISTDVHEGIFPLVVSTNIQLYIWILWILLLIALIFFVHFLRKAIREKRNRSAALHLGSSLVLLVALASLTILYREQGVVVEHRASLPQIDIPFLSEFGVVWLLLFGAIFVMITLLARKKKE